ncbi:MAG: Rpp14/Pop5 family protein [Candidatus Woesearchaeota archaeon]
MRNKEAALPSSPSKTRIQPSNRERPRYVLYCALSPVTRETVPAGLKRMLGEIGIAEAGIMTISFDSKNNKGIIRTNSTQLSRVKAAITLLPQQITIEKVSGTIKTIKG